MKNLLDAGDKVPYCGRPLGLAFDTKGNNLIVMDSATGIFELNIDTNKLKIVVLAGAESFGEPVNIQILSKNSKF